MNKSLKLYYQLSRFPYGNRLFSRVLTFKAPYFATIHPKVIDLRAGLCKIEIKDRRSIQNHLGSINAGALCTLSEMTGGLAVDATIPKDLRWIPKKMEVAYLRKARGALVGSCSVDVKTLVPGDAVVTVEIKNTSSETVMRADILFYISQRPGKK